MTSLTLEKDALAVKVALNGKELKVALADGRTLTVPMDWYPRLLHASASEKELETLGRRLRN